jgi:hypothetical protein
VIFSLALVCILRRVFEQLVCILCRVSEQLVCILRRVSEQLVCILRRVFEQLVCILRRVFEQLVCILRRVFEQLVNSRAVITFNTFYDVISFQNLATLLISVFTLCYGPGLLFPVPPCIFLF